MERTIVLAASARIPRGSMVEVMQADDADGAVIAVTEIGTGRRHGDPAPASGSTVAWRAQVLDCRASGSGAGRSQTTLTLAAVDPVVAADVALREADAAASAAKAEADRWGGADKRPAPPKERFW
ncbi:hypothetical protein [Microbacterium sp.]|uniref:hypothetical protein n=1 Tax=Microbacterium sp. TaxID=51671 RepID=UPI0033403304